MIPVGACWCDFIRVIGAAFMRGLSPLIRGWTSDPFEGPPHDKWTDCSSFSRCGVANKPARGSQLGNVMGSSRRRVTGGPRRLHECLKPWACPLFYNGRPRRGDCCRAGSLAGDGTAEQTHDERPLANEAELTRVIHETIMPKPLEHRPLPDEVRALLNWSAPVNGLVARTEYIARLDFCVRLKNVSQRP